MPIALRGAVEENLERLENDGVLVKVNYSQWATPVMVVLKKDGSIRLCGDYKVSVNPALEVDQYPLPKPDDLFATLAGGNISLSSISPMLIISWYSRSHSVSW